MKRASLKEDQNISVALVQTALLPSEKTLLKGRSREFIYPLIQWERILSHLHPVQDVDYIVLPEAAIPYGVSIPVYPLEGVKCLLRKHFPEKESLPFPPLHFPYAVKNEKGIWMVTNGYLSQFLANMYNAELIIGLDDTDPKQNLHYNAAFHFIPHAESYQRYEKHLLLPLAESLPFAWAKKLSEQYGISSFFTPGDKVKILQGILPISLSICYEEMFSEFMREGRKKGSTLFVNITNDNWFPNAHLPREHFNHGRIRAIENGVFLLRACNTGITCVIDCLGRAIKTLDKPGKPFSAGVLVSSFKPYAFSSLYTFWGDGAIISIALIFSALCFRKRSDNK